MLPQQRVALRGPVVDRARVHEHFVLDVDEPVGSIVVQLVVLNQNL